MKQSITREQMLAQWKLMRAAEPMRLDCTITRTDGIDLDTIYESEMRAWYLRLLDTAPIERLAPVEASALAKTEVRHDLTIITTPEGCRRVLQVQFADWDSPIEPTAKANAVRACAANPYIKRPMAAHIGPGTVIVSGARGKLTTLLCALDTGPEQYLLDDSALASCFAGETCWV